MATPFQTTGYLADPKVASAVSGVLDAGAKAAATPYPQYNATTAAQYANYVPNLVATRSPDQITAQQGLSDLQGYTTGFTNQALQYAKNAAAPIQNQGVGQSQINQYMSPYLNSVVNSAMQNINETNNQQQQQLMGNAISKGAWGGDRAGIAAAALARQQNLSNNATLANLLNTGYGTALGEANVQQQADLNTQLYNRQLANASAAQLQNLGSTSQAAQMQQLQAQYNMGAGQQQQNQNELSSAYQQYLNANQYPYNQLNWYSNLISGAPAALGGQTVATIPQPSTVTAAGGLATTLAGMDLKGLFGGTTAKRGGAIRPNYASGGRMGFADAGAAVNPSIQAYNNYVNAARSGAASKSDLRDLYNIMRAAQRGNSGFYGDQTGGVTGGVAPVGGVITDYPRKPDTGLTTDQVDTITNTKTNTPLTIASTAGQAGSSSSAKIAAAGGVLALLAKLLGGGGGGGQGSGTKPGSTGNKPGTSGNKLSEDQQDALNEKAELVADKIALLEGSDLKNTNPEEYQKRMDELVSEMESISKQGGVAEKADSGESAADRRAAIIEEGKNNPANAWAKENGLAPKGVAPVSGGNAPKMRNPEDIANEGYKKTSDAGTPASEGVQVTGLEGVLPVSLIQPENAVEFAKNNGLEKASYDELKAMGLREDAIKEIIKESQSVDNARPLDAAEIAMQSSIGTDPNDPTSDPKYQQYINMGFTPEEARSAISANTSAADTRNTVSTQTTPEKQNILETPVDNSNIKYASNNTLDSLKDVYNSNISGINDAQSKYLDSLQTQYEAAKSTYGSQYDQALNGLQQSYASAKSALEEKYNTSQNGYTANYQTAIDKLDNQYKDAIGNLNNGYQTAIAKLGAEPSQKLEMTDAQKYVAGVENGTINPAVGAYGYKGYGGQKGQDPAVNNAYAQMVAYSTSNNKRMSEYGDYMANRENPAYQAYQNAEDHLAAQMEAARQKYEAENAALHEKAAEAYRNGLAPNQNAYAQAQAAMEDKYGQARSSAQEQYNSYLDSLQGSYGQQQQDAYDKFGSARGSAQDSYDQFQQQADQYYGDMYRNQNQDLMQNYNTSNIDFMPSIDQSSIGNTFDVSEIDKYVPAAPITFDSAGDFTPLYESQPLTFENANFDTTGFNDTFDNSSFDTNWNNDWYNTADTNNQTDWNTGANTDFTTDTTDWSDWTPTNEIVYPDYQTNDYNYGGDDEWWAKRGGRITRQHRAVGGPSAPKSGVAPITMNYGLSTQGDLRDMAMSNLGTGVLPITPSQEALASAYLLGGQ